MLSQKHFALSCYSITSPACNVIKEARLRFRRPVARVQGCHPPCVMKHPGLPAPLFWSPHHHNKCMCYTCIFTLCFLLMYGFKALRGISVFCRDKQVQADCYIYFLYLKFIFKFYFMSMSVLSACMSVYPWKPEDDVSPLEL